MPQVSRDNSQLAEVEIQFKECVTSVEKISRKYNSIVKGSPRILNVSICVKPLMQYHIYNEVQGCSLYNNQVYLYVIEISTFIAVSSVLTHFTMICR